MNDSNNHSEHLSLFQIKEYLAGNLNNAESHLVEKHLMECSLCSDALVGLEKMDPKILEKDVAELRSLVSEKAGRKSRTAWTVRIAASIVLLSIVTYLVINYQYDSIAPSIREPFSQTEDTLKIPENTETVVSRNDSLNYPDTNDDSMPLAVAESEPDQEVPAQDIVSQVTGGAGAKTKDNLQMADADIEADQEEIAAEEEATNKLDIAKLETAAEPKEESIAITEAPVAELPETQAKPQELQEEVSKKSETKRARSVREQPVEAAPQLDAVQGFAFSADNALIVHPLPGASPPDQNAEPEGGTLEYTNQILNNLKYPTQAASEGITGQVTASFVVTKEGQISDLKIIQGLGFGCDEEALRVIKEGGGWVPAVKDGISVPQVIEVKVPFPKPDR